jgi:hypothetical protein
MAQMARRAGGCRLIGDRDAAWVDLSGDEIVIRSEDLAEDVMGSPCSLSLLGERMRFTGQRRDSGRYFS